ncbi:MAG TPA: adenylate/guanylate cyclase domain-containing protein, partial [Streptosporangiaceae bacterium]|nr:adenylate/guanylate cyclase domain-containing protein [Streptosporangiaceae bacterium]
MASRRRRLDPVGPFGNPDGSRADIEDLISEFVDFGGNPAYGHLATRANDSMVRVIVGKLGAGKTVYLRRLQDFQAHQDSVYADVPQQSLPRTEVIVKACQWFSDSVLVEKWMQIWERAIMRALASHLLRRPELRAQVENGQAAEIEQSYARLLGDFRRPRSIYSQVRDIINERHTAHQLSTYLDDPLWDDLEDLLGEVVARCKPIYFYLDAVDEEFSHAPMYWLKCQEGLFYQVMRLLRDHKLGGRLHVVVCIRDIVMSSVYRSEHAPRYYNEPHIRVLTWDRGSLLYLLGQKLARLPPSLLMRRPASGAPTIGDWLGVEGQWPGPDGDGPIEDYLLSHTRLIPRDIISLGNELSEEVLRHKQGGRDALPPAALAAVVQRCAKRFGDSQLAQCANQVSSDLMPAGAALHDYSELFTSTQSYINGVQEDVRSFVQMIGVDRFSRGDLAALQEVADLHFQEPTNLASVLWQNGLLGYLDEAGRRRFYSLGDVEQFHLPPEADTYVLHPCLVYAVGGIRHVGEQDSAGAGDARRTRPLVSPKRSDLPEAPDAAPRSGGGQALLEPGPAEVRDRQVSGLPSGLVTLLFSDIEGSTRLVKALRDRYWQILAEHRRLVRAAVAEYAGYEVDAQGDAFFVTFADAKQAVLCALEIQRALAGHQWPAGTPVRVRIGIHTGHAVPAEGAYTGLAVHRAARICAAARGGQVFLSQATQTIVEDEEEELGFTLVDAGEHRLKDLDRPVRLFQLAAPGLDLVPAARGEAARTAAAGGVHGFPALLTSFIGRAGPLAEVTGLLERGRLVTISGPGGSGKTRLADVVARRVADRFADGVWLVELAPVADPAQVPPAVAAAIGVREQPGVPAAAALARVLARQQLLLVLDNCEHVIGAAAELCAGLLLACDDVRVLATSREPLRVAGEARYRLGPLSMAGPDELADAARAEAVALFADRARGADARFVLDGQTGPAVAKIVARLDGMPLAIELAAARVEALGVAQLADRLDDRFALLADADRLAAGRHRSLAATVEWSYRLLDEHERRVFRVVSVFPGPFTLEAAEAVAGADAGPAVLHLVDCSLLVPPRPGADGRSRYGMLETLRAYGAGLLAQAGEEAGAAAALAGNALGAAEEAAAGLQTSTGEVAAARWLDAEDATMVQVLAWAMDHDAAVAVRLAVALAPWWLLRGRAQEGYPLLRAAADRAEPGSDQWCAAQYWLGQIALDAPDMAGALDHFTAVRDA